MSRLKKLVCKSMREDFMQDDFYGSQLDNTYSANSSQTAYQHDLPESVELFRCHTNERSTDNSRAKDGRREEQLMGLAKKGDFSEFNDMRSPKFQTGIAVGVNPPHETELEGYPIDRRLCNVAGRERGEVSRSADHNRKSLKYGLSLPDTESKGSFSSSSMQTERVACEYITYEGGKITERAEKRWDKGNKNSNDCIIDEGKITRKGNESRKVRNPAYNHKRGFCAPRTDLGTRNSNQGRKNPMKRYDNSQNTKSHDEPQKQLMNYGNILGCANFVVDLFFEDKPSDKKRPEKDESSDRGEMHYHLQEPYRSSEHIDWGSYRASFVRSASSTANDSTSCVEETARSDSSRSSEADGEANFDESSMGSVEMLVHHVLCTQDNRIAAQDWVS
eukprot:scaffold91_cov127-Cylindrotheca_fusiformis.AAC.31